MLKMSNLGRMYVALMTAMWFFLTALLPNILIMTAKRGRRLLQRSGRAPSTRAGRVRSALHAHILRSDLAPEASPYLRPRGNDLIANERRRAQVRDHGRGLSLFGVYRRRGARFRHLRIGRCADRSGRWQMCDRGGQQHWRDQSADGGRRNPAGH